VKQPDDLKPLLDPVETVENIPGYDEFELDLEHVLRQQLPGKFFGDVAKLTEENIRKIPEKAKGAYVLYELGNDGWIPVYAGKTDARHGFRNRLGRHRDTIHHRKNLNEARIGFRAVRILVFSNFDVEAILIDEIQKKNEAYLLWNTSGFGSNDPGHNRETQEPADFDKEHPINIDEPLDWAKPGSHNVHELLVRLKDDLPYTLRYETDPVTGGSGKKKKYAKHTVGHAELRDISITVPSGVSITTRLLLTLIVTQLRGKQWVATIFPDRVILYKSTTQYPFALETI